MIKDNPSNDDVLTNGAVAAYRQADLPEHCGNPLIETLPSLICLEEDARDLLKYYPIKLTHIRTHAVMNAADFFAPLPIHLVLYQQIDCRLMTKNEDTNDQE